MKQGNGAIAETYYKLMSERNVDALGQHLHPDVQFTAPLAKTKGKKLVLEATRKFAAFFISLTVRSKLESANQAMVVYDLELPAPIGQVSSAALLTLQEGLIIAIELFYDARSFERK